MLQFLVYALMVGFLTAIIANWIMDKLSREAIHIIQMYYEEKRRFLDACATGPVPGTRVVEKTFTN